MSDWPALSAARRGPASPRVAFVVGDDRVGSVAVHDLPALAAHRDVLAVGDDGVVLRVSPADRDAAMARVNAALRSDGRIAAWRDEPFAVWALPAGRVVMVIERASARFWGTLTLGAHANGYVADASGRPTHLWIARRAWTKATDPGRLDNLIGAGVPAGQSPLEAVRREAWEEAGLRPAQLDGLSPGRVMALWRDIPEGFQHEWLYAFDLRLAPDAQPVNQDGEVESFRCLPVDEAMACAAGDEMTVDAALVTLDFGLRHRLGPPSVRGDLAARAAPLWVTPPAGPLAMLQSF